MNTSPRILLHALVMLATVGLHRLHAFQSTIFRSKIPGGPVRFLSFINGNRWGAVAADSSMDRSSAGSAENQEKVSLYRAEGLFAVEKPSNWTSNDVVSYIRGVLERDARDRGAKTVRVGSRKNKDRIVRVGHGGTLDPLATGVLVIGVGKGTKELQSYLSGSKRYSAGVELGFETTTLDMEGNVTKTAPFDHVTLDAVKAVLPKFVGKISQIPPIFSAIKKDGIKMYEHAREGASAEDVKLEPREVEVYSCQLFENDGETIPRFSIDVECGGGTYIRSLVRDIGYELDTVATTTYLVRTKQGQFLEEQCLPKDQWSPDLIYGAIDQNNKAQEG